MNTLPPFEPRIVTLPDSRLARIYTARIGGNVIFAHDVIELVTPAEGETPAVYRDLAKGLHVAPVAGFDADTATEWPTDAALIAALAGPSVAEQLAAAKRTLVARATHRRWEVETGGIVVGGMTVATDDRSKTLLLQADREARENALGTRWKGTDGVWVPLTAAQVRGAAAAMSAHVRACFAREEQLHDLINAAADLAALDALKPTVETFAL